MSEFTHDLTQEFKTLVEIVAKLRGPDGCPWDKDQSQNSLIQYAIEEAHELAEAIESGQQEAVKEELGDFLFQVILQSQVAQDEKKFDLSEVIHNLNQKMVYRHPHVFGKEKTKDLEQIWQNWEKLKSQEKANSGQQGQKPVFNYPQNLPALQAAHKIGVKTGHLKFDWDSADEVFEKVEEELRELKEAFKKSGSKEEIRHEIGDLLFAIAQFARHLDLEAESCLREQNRRFQNRFSYVLQNSGVSREEFVQMPSAQKEDLWRQAKKHLK